ncbi:carbonic anhydrase [Micromonospora chokoriensis]|uniref:hypothetical protein n=1 Tax=Micromonospora chokoriensis TaxID=356851 RepID=UPI001E4D8E3D|nr:hypothetical protein [Micromonospora chokoriensis]
MENGVRANAVAQVAALSARSSIISEKVHQGTLRVVGARYDLDNGRVSLVA